MKRKTITVNRKRYRKNKPSDLYVAEVVRMGQRHQIYVNMPKKLGIAGFHHQWLYGMNAINSLGRVLKFYENQGKYGPLKENVGYGLRRQSQIIASLYSTDVETGYWHFVHDLSDGTEPNEEVPSEVKDPRNGDNNDGITIIDFSQGDFRYCFMSLGHLEGEVEPKAHFKPMSAREYLLCYYPEFSNKLGRLDWRLKEQTGEVKRADINQEEFDHTLHNLISFDHTLHNLISIESKAKLLTLTECKKLFPAMYIKEPKTKAVK